MFNLISWIFFVSSNLYNETEISFIVISSVIMLHFVCSFFFILGKSILKIIKNIEINIVENNKFKYIFENQNESVMIISDKKTRIDYVNNKFLKEFQNKIMELYDDE